MAELTLKQLNRLETKPLFSVKDPVSALTHFVGFLAAILLLPFLMIKAAVKSYSLLQLTSVAVFGLSMIVLYGASTSYHTFILPFKPSRFLKKLDHISIFYLIAGTYTPICLITLSDRQGSQLLTAVWIIAFLGTVLKLFWVYCPKYVSSFIYIAMGWTAIFKMSAIYQALALPGFIWLITGGIFYTIGGIIYAFKWKFSRDWGAHEIFHLFVLAGSICHYVLILFFVI
jgi:hemolysin III